MKKNPWQLWLDLLNRIIESENPRQVNHDLTRCITLWPQTGATLENVEDILAAIVKLRQSKCYGRFDHEGRLMERIAWMVDEIERQTSPPKPKQRDLFEDESASGNLSTENQKKLEAIASYCIDARKSRLKKDDKKYLRVKGAFEILRELCEYPECEGYCQEAVTIAENIIKRKSEKSIVSAVEFIATFYSHQNLDLPETLLKEINAFEASCKDEDIVRSLNIVLVDSGELDPLSAMMRMDDFTDDFDEEY
ncbi:MAG: hypothetical protein P1V20_04930 [Verrucomicrobiales bacterium]|nr:hypothetical protein [Verrucomicrobiales bacterium]